MTGPAPDGWSRRLGNRVMSSYRSVTSQPLLLNAVALGLSGVLTSGLGVVYWAVAARLYSPSAVGINGSLLSLVMLIANVAQFNLRSGWGRFIPGSGSRVRALVGWGYAIALTIAAIGGLGVCVFLLVNPDALPGVTVTSLLVWLFPATVILWTAFSLQDQLLTALRRTTVVPIENAIYAVLKIGALFVFAAALPDYGILASWALPTLLGVGIISAWLLFSLVPEAARRPQLEHVEARDVARFVGIDFVSSLFAIASTAFLPVIVLGLAGAETSGHFYVATLIGTSVQLIPTVFATSLLVEASGGHSDSSRDLTRVARHLVVLLLPVVLILVIAAPLILEVFGHEYAVAGSDTLRLLALAGLPYAVNQLAFAKLRVERRVGAIVVAQAVLAGTIVVGSSAAVQLLGISGIGLVVLVAHAAVAAVMLRTELPGLVRSLLRPGGGALGGRPD